MLVACWSDGVVRPTSNFVRKYTKEISVLDGLKKTLKLNTDAVDHHRFGWACGGACSDCRWYVVLLCVVCCVVVLLCCVLNHS